MSFEAIISANPNVSTTPNETRITSKESIVNTLEQAQAIILSLQADKAKLQVDIINLQKEIDYKDLQTEIDYKDCISVNILYKNKWKAFIRFVKNLFALNTNLIIL